MALAAYVAEDGLIGHQRKAEALGLAKAGPHPTPGVGECVCEGGRKEGGWRRKHPYRRGGGWDRGLMSRKPEKGITFEMQIKFNKKDVLGLDKYTKPQGL